MKSSVSRFSGSLNAVYVSFVFFLERAKRKEEKRERKKKEKKRKKEKARKREEKTKAAKMQLSLFFFRMTTEY